MKYMRLHWTIVDQVLFNNPIEDGFVDVVVPDAVGVDDDDRTAGTDAEAGGDAPLHPFGVVVAAKFAQFVGQTGIKSLRLAIRITK